MDIFVYFSDRLNVGLDELEDALDEALGDIGEVTGTGSGESGSNIDLEVEDDNEAEEVLELIKSVLKKLSVPKSSTVVVNGVEYGVFDT